jgi:hypothetical protein
LVTSANIRDQYLLGWHDLGWNDDESQYASSCYVASGCGRSWLHFHCHIIEMLCQKCHRNPSKFASSIRVVQNNLPWLHIRLRRHTILLLRWPTHQETTRKLASPRGWFPFHYVSHPIQIWVAYKIKTCAL